MWRQHLGSRAGRVQRQEGGTVGGAGVTARKLERRRVLREVGIWRKKRGNRQEEGLRQKRSERNRHHIARDGRRRPVQVQVQVQVHETVRKV